MKSRRRQFLVDRFQYRLLGFNLLYFVGIVVVLLVSILAPIIYVLNSSSSTPQEMEHASAVFLELHARLLPALTLALLVASVHSILVSHRIAGPLYRFRKVFGVVAQGDLTARAGVRKKDYLGRDAESINGMIVALDNRVSEIARSAEEVRTAMDECMARTDDPEELLDLEEKIASLEEATRAFRLPESEPAPGAWLSSDDPRTDRPTTSGSLPSSQVP
jgi:methyl-accepting chemotaxis protein